MLLDFSAGFFGYNKNNSFKKANGILQPENEKLENSNSSDETTVVQPKNRNDKMTP